MKLVKEYSRKKVRDEERKKLGRGMLRQKESEAQKNIEKDMRKIERAR